MYRRAAPPTVSRWLALTLLLTLGPAASVAAQDPAADSEAAGGEDEELSPEELEAIKAKIQGQLEWKTGAVDVRSGLAQLKLDDKYRYLDQEQAAFVLYQLWGNPPGGDAPLGMIFPSDLGPLDDDNWAVVITYEEDGYVEDDDADDIDYDELLQEMKDGTAEENTLRTEQGYPTVDLIGWAEPPHYDPSTKKLYWAKELNFQGDPAHTLNYDIRVLGRKGVLVLQAISSISALEQVKGGMKDVLAMTEFTAGNRYEDFDPDLDNVAAYGIGALVAGKLASKAGLFAGLLVVLLKAKKLVIIGVIAIGAMLAKILGRKREDD